MSTRSAPPSAPPPPGEERTTQLRSGLRIFAVGLVAAMALGLAGLLALPPEEATARALLVGLGALILIVAVVVSYVQSSRATRRAEDPSATEES